MHPTSMDVPLSLSIVLEPSSSLAEVPWPKEDVIVAVEELGVGGITRWAL